MPWAQIDLVAWTTGVFPCYHSVVIVVNKSFSSMKNSPDLSLSLFLYCLLHTGRSILSHQPSWRAQFDHDGTRLYMAWSLVNMILLHCNTKMKASAACMIGCIMCGLPVSLQFRRKKIVWVISRRRFRCIWRFHENSCFGRWPEVTEQKSFLALRYIK